MPRKDYELFAPKSNTERARSLELVESGHRFYVPPIGYPSLWTKAQVRQKCYVACTADQCNCGRVLQKALHAEHKDDLRAFADQVLLLAAETNADDEDLTLTPEKVDQFHRDVLEKFPAGSGGGAPGPKQRRVGAVSGRAST